MSFTLTTNAFTSCVGTTTTADYTQGDCNSIPATPGYFFTATCIDSNSLNFYVYADGFCSSTPSFTFPSAGSGNCIQSPYMQAVITCPQPPTLPPPITTSFPTTSAPTTYALFNPYFGVGFTGNTGYDSCTTQSPTSTSYYVQGSCNPLPNESHNYQVYCDPVTSFYTVTVFSGYILCTGTPVIYGTPSQSGSCTTIALTPHASHFVITCPPSTSPPSTSAPSTSTPSIPSTQSQTHSTSLQAVTTPVPTIASTNATTNANTSAPTVLHSLYFHSVKETHPYIIA